MKRIVKYFPFIFLVILILVVFGKWFMSGLISAGDFWPFYKSMFIVKPLSLYAWNFDQGTGLGGYAGSLGWLYLDFGVPVAILGQIVGLDWGVIERIAFMYPFLILSSLSSGVLFRKIFGKTNFSIFSTAVFTLNTYILMLIGGGQILLGLAYSLTPFVFLTFIGIIDGKDFSLKNLKWSLAFTLLFSMQIIIDLRIAYVTLLAVLIYWIFKIISSRDIKKLLTSFLFGFLIPGFVSVLLNFFWILPTVVNRQNPLSQLGEAYTSVGMVKFFSFANFENTISLLHPNWPENIFGKVGFMKPEFLILPVVVFASLFFIQKLKNHSLRIYILFFAFLGLLGAFLAKGANEPFGQLYLWMFNHVPGFMMFRDPTKWYTLVAISYSILIPFSVWRIHEWLKLRNKFTIYNLQFTINNKILNLQNIFIILTSLYLILLIRPAILGQLGGTLKPSAVPNEYTKLEQYISSQSSFSRTLWVPTLQRFGYYSNSHPAVPAQDFYGTVDERQIINHLNTSENLLQDTSVKYVIVPYDSQGEIFLKDRKYNDSLYLKTVKDIEKISWLKQIDGFGKIAIFEVPSPREHFWTTAKNLILNYRYISPVEYRVTILNAKKGDVVVFSENFDKNWQANGTKFSLKSVKYENRFNSFILPYDGTYSLNVYYSLQKYVVLGEIISLTTLAAILGFLAFTFVANNKRK